MKKLILIVTALAVTALTAAAQSISYVRQATFPISQDVTLTQAGRLSIIVTGNVGYTTGHVPIVRILIDGTIEDTYNVPAVSDGQWDLFARTYQTASLASGSHTVQVAMGGTMASANGATLLVIAEGEPHAGVQTALDQLMADLTTAYQNADTALLATLQTQLNAVHTALQNQINQNTADIAALQAANTALVARITALEESQTEQDELVAELTAQLAANNTRLTTLETSLSQLQATVTGMQTQIVELRARRGGGSSKGLKDSDYLIMGGIAAGAAGLGVGIYSLFDEVPAPVLESEEVKTTPRPGFKDR
jgi:uncharacterized coiled-coil protein SlyX